MAAYNTHLDVGVTCHAMHGSRASATDFVLGPIEALPHVRRCRALRWTARGLQMVPSVVPRDHGPVHVEVWHVPPARAARAAAAPCWDYDAMAQALRGGGEALGFLAQVESQLDERRSVRRRPLLGCRGGGLLWRRGPVILSAAGVGR